MGGVITNKTVLPDVPKAEPKRKHKYGAVKTEVDGIVFASKKEAARYVELKLAERTGQITNLELQPEYEIVINGIKCGKYVADFRYKGAGKVFVEDVKGMKTPVYRFKKKIVEALYSIIITEV